MNKTRLVHQLDTQHLHSIPMHTFINGELRAELNAYFSSHNLAATHALNLLLNEPLTARLAKEAKAKPSPQKTTAPAKDINQC